MLDDGRLTDSQGRTVDFRNTVVIMTSNIGSPHLMEGAAGGGEIPQEVQEMVMREMQAHFRPEFINRVDDVVIFKPLSLPEIKRIVALMTEELRGRLSGRRIEIEITEPASEAIARQGFDPVFGARPLKRFIQHELESRIARALLAGDIGEGARIRVDLEDGELTVHSGGKVHPRAA